MKGSHVSMHEQLPLLVACPLPLHGDMGQATEHSVWLTQMCSVQVGLRGAHVCFVSMQDRAAIIPSEHDKIYASYMFCWYITLHKSQ